MSLPYINFKRERRFGDKVNATFAFVSQNLKPVAKSALYIGGPFALVTTIVLQVYQYNTFGGLGDSVAGPGTVKGPIGIASGGLFSSGMLIGYLAITYLLLFIMAALTIAIAQRHLRAYVETGDASIEIEYLWKTIWRDFLSALGSTIGISVLLGVVFFGGAMLAGVFIAAVLSPITIILTVLGLFAVMLMVSSVLLLVFPIRNFERVNFFEALGRAFTLNSGNWWSTAGLVFITFIIQFAIAFALSIPFYLVMFMQGLHMDNPAEMMRQASEFSWATVFNALASVVYSIGFTLLGSLMLVALSFQYFNLREKKEASGLLERMESFGVAPTVHEEEEKY